MSSSCKFTFGGMGTGPQTPWPPALILAARSDCASASPLYFATISLSPAPTTLALSLLEFRSIQ